MHEAGLAAAIVRAIEARGRGTTGLRILVSAGGHDPADFEAALRLHLAALAPDLDVAALEILHRPVARPCLACGRSFEAVAPDAVCPACGGPGLPPLEAERIELEWATDAPTPDAPTGPPAGASPGRDRPASDGRDPDTPDGRDQG
ncbi:MAG TPA: hydrogenase/urease maturation nickel metallochaperone HypA, partial [Candidatus Binatia bacterium]|nr:hydrogenase/urease maturation nickel metallochaperone HypA [Candidatus Binatia bacterium]